MHEKVAKGREEREGGKKKVKETGQGGRREEGKG